MPQEMLFQKKDQSLTSKRKKRCEAEFTEYADQEFEKYECYKKIYSAVPSQILNRRWFKSDKVVLMGKVESLVELIILNYRNRHQRLI